MKKFITPLIAICLAFSVATAYAEQITSVTVSESAEPETLTPTCGMMMEAGELEDSEDVSLSLMSSPAQEQTLEEYLREQILNHSTSINISAFRIPASEFSTEFFTFVLSNGDLPVHTGYTRGTTLTVNGVKYISSFDPSYVYSSKEISDTKREQLDALTTELANYASKGKTELEKGPLDHLVEPLFAITEETQTPGGFQPGLGPHRK